MKRKLLAIFLTITMVLTGVAAAPVRVDANPLPAPTIWVSGNILQGSIPSGVPGSTSLIVNSGNNSHWHEASDLTSGINLLAFGPGTHNIQARFQDGAGPGSWSNTVPWTHPDTGVTPLPAPTIWVSGNILHGSIPSGVPSNTSLLVNSGNNSHWFLASDLISGISLFAFGSGTHSIQARFQVGNEFSPWSNTVPWTHPHTNQPPSINFNVSPSGGGWASYVVSWNHSLGRWNVQITASPASGFVFDYWRGVDGTVWSRHNPATTEMSSGQTWSPTAVFRQGTHSITISPSGNFSLNIGQTRQLWADTWPTGGIATWTSSNHNIASVSSNGLVTAVSPGSATITARHGGAVASVTATITAAVPTSVSVTSPGNTIAPGSNMRFSASVLPTNASQNVNWSIAPAVTGVSVNSTGLVTVSQNVHVGTNITVRAVARGTNVSGTRSVTVTAQGQGQQGEITAPVTGALAVPANVHLQGTVLHWNPVANARGYTIYVGGVVRSAPTVATSFGLGALGLPAGNHSVQVRAMGDGTATSNSPLSTAVIFTAAGPAVTPAPTPAPTPAATPAPGEQPSQWAQGYVNTSIEIGLVPQNLRSQYTQATTRAEFAALSVALYETVTGHEIAGRMQFDDTNDINMQKMGYLGILRGDGHGNATPHDTLTREQAATMLARLADVINRPFPAAAATFADNAAIGPWAIDAVGQMQAMNIMNGVGNNMFDPQGPYTREQSIVTMLRMFYLVR